jgi:MoaA/NifB/PqqE/SkfB family radical SAM enzyme
VGRDLGQIFRLPGYVFEGLRYHAGGRLFRPKPRMIQFPVCDRCNARCLMCRRWQKDAREEIGLAKIREVFSGGIFSRVEEVNVHGGEPTLRKDLAEICEIIQRGCPSLKRIWISTNGLGAERIRKRVEEILDVLDFRKLDLLEINVSIDGIGQTHDTIRGVPGGFEQSLDTLRTLQLLAKERPLKISMGTVIQPLNLHQLAEIGTLARTVGVSHFFQPLAFDAFFNLEDRADLAFSAEDRGELSRFIEERLAQGMSPTHFFWSDFLGMMDGQRRKSPCAFDRYVFSLYPTGEVLPCSQKDWILFGNVFDQPAGKIWFSRDARKIRERMKREVCPTCPNYCGVEFSLRKEFFTYLRFYLREKAFSRSRPRQ